MSSGLPSSFASAAAGQNSSRDSRTGRVDGRGAAVGDWSRRDGRSTNGTLTLRRSSTTPLGQAPSQPLASIDNTIQQTPFAAVPPTRPVAHENGPAKYTRDDLLNVYHNQKSNGDVSKLFMGGWNPGHVNGNAQRGWGKSNDNHVPQEPGACWDDTGDTVPMALMDLSAEEKEAFSTEINSPLKPPTQKQEGHQPGTNGRKASLSQGTANAYGVSSPSTSRPGTRRRETVESGPFSAGLASPTTTSRYNNRDDPNFWFRGKNTDKDADLEDSDADSPARDTSARLPVGGLMRSNTGGTIGTGAGSSMWPPTNQTASGGGGAFGSFALPGSGASERRTAGGGGSRLAHLIPKEGSESIEAKNQEQPNPLAQSSWRSRPRTDTDPFGDDGMSGSAILGGAQDTGPAGMSQANRAGVLGTPVKGSTGDFGMAGLNLGDDGGPVSPSETNPYRSPPAERHDHDSNDLTGADKSHLAHEQPANFGSISRGFGGVPFDGSDRSQTSSVGAKPYPGLSSLTGGWPGSGAPIGTPDRERPNFGAAFGNSLFSPVGEMQSPGLPNFNTVFGPAGAGGIGTGSMSRASKLGSLFPAAMQAQMQSHEPENNLADSLPDLRQSNPLGAIGRTNFGMPARETESPMRSNRGVFEELFPSSDQSRSHGVFGSAEPGHPGATATASQSFTPVSGGLPFGGGSQAGGEPPVQARQMVMPDRMRWVYLDPQGQVQGPFTGLEMNDWYKANFFTPDLRVRKVEDHDFEPLGQLIRRIGNSREPFLVPQIGIPHGPPTQQGPFSPSGNSGVIPPLSGVFPSFGRTLTAEEQNNLERRKQEEQYLMVQQREFVMRQQAMSKFAMQTPSLQHHSSAHSLQSQPSFSSMTAPNPIGMPPQPPQQPIGAMPPAAGFFDGAMPPQGNLPGHPGNEDPFRDDDLTSAERQVLASMPGAPGSGVPHPIGTSAPIEQSLRSGLPETAELLEDPEGFRNRLQEFEGLRAQHEAEQAARAEEAAEAKEVEEPSSVGVSEPEEPPTEPQVLSGKAARAAKKRAAEEAALSLTQQVQKTQAAAAAAQIPEPGMPMPFPPPPGSSGTPLPAPTAQRARSNLPEQYSRSQSGTPDTTASANVQPPPLAPWAKEPGSEGPKGPSLKEIQEAEARKAAKAEEQAAAIRKAALEQEALLIREREKAAAASAGLPATSTWGHGSPAPAGSPWIKPGATKGAPVGSSSSSSTAGKKTLAEIQREEELRKQKAKESVIQSGVPLNVSKSYANLASKPGAALPNMPSAAAAAAAAAASSGAGWATVGAGGKVKVPTGPSAPSRSVSAAAVKTVASPAKPVSKPVVNGPNGKSDNTAMDEFNKWVSKELGRGLNVNDISGFQATLEVLPLEHAVIADAVYSYSTTMDGRHFAEEYIRRKKLAERGIVEKQPGSKTGAAGGGWSEVAKKGGPSSQPRDADAGMQAADFKVVPGRKKGKK